MAHGHTVWVGALANRLRIPLWAFVLLFAACTYALYVLARSLAGSTLVDPEDILFLLLMFVPLGISGYVPKMMNALEEHALSMVESSVAVRDPLATLPRASPLLLITVLIFFGLFIPWAAVPSSDPGNEADVLLLVPVFLLVFANSTALWTMGYSLVAIFRLGQLPLKLKDFALDRLLGLRPFATACLRITALYYLLLLLVAGPDFATSDVPPAILLQDVALLVLGIPLFLLPLLSLRAKLVRARAEKTAWINDRFYRAMQRIDARGDGDLPLELQGELLILDKIQREVQAIKSWPFDMGVVARLVTILLSVMAILLSAVIRNILHI